MRALSGPSRTVVAMVALGFIVAAAGCGSGAAICRRGVLGEASHVTENVQVTSRNLRLSEEEIRERMSGNICRCGSYPNIVKAIADVKKGGAS